MPARRPQINFQVESSLKTLYEESRAAGHWVTRLCAAGLLLLVEDARARTRAIRRLREWEAEYADARPEQIRAFVEACEGAMQAGPRGGRPGRKARSNEKGAGRG